MGLSISKTNEETKKNRFPEENIGKNGSIVGCAPLLQGNLLCTKSHHDGDRLRFRHFHPFGGIHKI